MQHKAIILGTIVTLLILGGISTSLYGLSANEEIIVVPVLQTDGTITAGSARQSGLLASVIRDVYNVANLKIRIFSEQEMADGDVFIRNAPTYHYISFFCPPGTDTPAYAVLGGAEHFYSGLKIWSWGAYVGYEATRLVGGDSVNDIFLTTKYIGNPIMQQLFPMMTEQNFNAGRYIASGESSAGDVVIDCIDSDGDGLNDTYEINVSNTDPNDADTDDDGISDGEELTGRDINMDFQGDIDLDGDGWAPIFVTDPLNPDTDSDGIQDGTEQGRSVGISDTDTSIFIADADNTTVTNPTNANTDGGSVSDGVEDPNHDGQWLAIDCETDPNDGSDDIIECGDGTLQRCGQDRMVGGGDDEVCDTALDPNCLPGCQESATCGNGIVEGDEVCDDGNTCDGDGNWCGAQGDLPSVGQLECDGRNAGNCIDNDATDVFTDGCANCQMVEPFICIDISEANGPRSKCEFVIPDSSGGGSSSS